MLALLLIVGGDAPPASAAKASQACPTPPYGLAPDGPAATRFTMLIRINTQGNVNTWTQFNTDPSHEGLAPFVRPQDIFVLNTRFTGSGQFPPMTTSVAAGLAASLRATFPCNRIIDLNGMSLDPTQAGYAFTGIDDPNVFALITDFEQDDWNCGRVDRPGAPALDEQVPDGLPEDQGMEPGPRLDRRPPIRSESASGRVWPPRTSAPGTTARSRRTSTRRTCDSVLASSARRACRARTPARRVAPPGSAPGPSTLRLQYNFKFITKKIKVPGKKKKRKKTIRLPLKKKAKPVLSNLAMEISFTDSPQASARQAILSTSPAQAAACVRPGLKQGVGAFFFFAAEDAMRELFLQPQVAALRPPIGATSSSGGTGGVGSPG